MSRNDEKRALRSFVNGREPSIDRRFRPKPTENQKKMLFTGIDEEEDSTIEQENTAELDENYEPSNENSSFSSSQEDEELDSVGAMVYLRFRPIKEESAFTAQGNVLIVRPSSCESTKASNNKNTMEKQYVFNDIFHREIPQADVYENCVRMKIDAGDSFTLLTYGPSGSGKTYTLLGTDTNPGIIPRSLEHVFSLYDQKIYPNPSVKIINGQIVILEDRDIYTEMELRKNLLSDCPSNTSMDTISDIISKDHDFANTIDEDCSVFVWISFIEIYNENVYDLLQAPLTNKPNATMAAPRRNLKIVGNDGNVFVKELTAVNVQSSVEALHLLKFGLQHVNYASTSINNNSSRSHCIFIIDILKYSRQGDLEYISYRFCDLAGSERLQKTGNVGSRLKEAQRINKSLLVLGRCLDAANSNSNRKKSSEIIPYRESKLTMLLQSALLGKEKLTMIVNIMPADKYYEENINVLSFASIAKNIIFKKSSNKMQKSRCSFVLEQRQVSAVENKAQLELLHENIFLRSEVGRLTDTLEVIKERHADELSELEQNLRYELTTKHCELTKMRLKAAEDHFKTQIAALERQWQEKCDSLKNKYEWEIEDLREELSDLKHSRKRRTSVSPDDAERAKRPTMDVEIVESDDTEDDENGERNESTVDNDEVNAKTNENSLKDDSIVNAKRPAMGIEIVESDDTEDDENGDRSESTVDNDEVNAKTNEKSLKDGSIVNAKRSAMGIRIVESEDTEDNEIGDRNESTVDNDEVNAKTNKNSLKDGSIVNAKRPAMGIEIVESDDTEDDENGEPNESTDDNDEVNAKTNENALKDDSIVNA